MRARRLASAALCSEASAASWLARGRVAQYASASAGEAQWTPAETHLPENLSDQPLELILVELKGKPGAGHGK